MARIAVLGLGVAGLAAARHLALAGQAPLLIAPDATIPFRGETLSHRALPTLESLGWRDLLDAEVALAGAGRFSVWGDEILRQDTAQENGFHVDRPLLQTRMIESLAEDGVERVCASAVTLEHLPEGVRIVLSDGREIDVAVVIDATGRAALSSGPSADRRRLDRLVAAYCVCPLEDDDEVAAATLVEAVAGGWWYMSPVPGRRMMLGLFTDSDLLPEGLHREGGVFVALAAETCAISARMESLALAPAFGAAPPSVVPATSTIAARVWDGRILRAGDAAVSLDPLGANGLATALWSGTRAAQATQALAMGDTAIAHQYEHAFLEGVVNHLSAQRSLYTAERRFSSSPFWARRQSPPEAQG